MTAGQLLYLSRADIEAIDLPPREVAAAIAAMCAAKARGATAMVPKSHFKAPPGLVGGSTFFSMPAALADPPVAAVKWVGLNTANHARGLPHISGLVVLSDAVTGVPTAIMDGEWITGARTAGMTAVAAEHLARADSATIGFIACGVQAHSHLTALAARFPLRRVLAYGHRPGPADAFATHARALGFAAEAVADPAAAVQDCDIVVTSVPESAQLMPYLDPAWIKPGAFVGAVNLGRCWIRHNLRQLDLLATDDHGQSQAIAPSGRLAWPGPYDADLADLVGGAKPGRTDDRQRTMFVFSGLALADVAVAARLHREALNRKLGTFLPL